VPDQLCLVYYEKIISNCHTRTDSERFCNASDGSPMKLKCDFAPIGGVPGFENDNG